jgi:hypothetical protein
VLDRRQSIRDKVIYGGVAEINGRGSTMDCVVRNISEGGAYVEFDETAKLPEEMRLTIARKGRSFLARMIWRQADKVGLAFRTMTASDPPASSDLDERLRRSERKKRQLQRRIRELLGEG